MLTIHTTPDAATTGVAPKSTIVPPLAGSSHQQICIRLSALMHDLRQPLSTIELCADYLNLILPETELRIRQQLGLLQEQVQTANCLIDEAVRLLSKQVQAHPEPGQIRAAAS
jgi:hypothetical protein